MTYDSSNQAILKKVVSDNPKAPNMRLELTINGTKYKAGLWVWTRKDGSPVQDKNGNGQYIGQIELDTYGQEVQNQGMAQAKQAAQPSTIEKAAEFFGDESDSIPF